MWMMKIFDAKMIAIVATGPETCRQQPISAEGLCETCPCSSSFTAQMEGRALGFHASEALWASACHARRDDRGEHNASNQAIPSLGQNTLMRHSSTGYVHGSPGTNDVGREALRWIFRKLGISSLLRWSWKPVDSPGQRKL
jgi:hypothetical protein